MVNNLELVTADSPCMESEFWCPESSDKNPECIPRVQVCNGVNECSSGSDERDCIGMLYVN